MATAGHTDQRDDAGQAERLRKAIRGKASLRAYYREVYGKYEECLARCPASGGVLELGSGMGFLKEVLPQARTSDVLLYPGLDAIVDATRLPFADESLRLICMLDVFHHVPDVGAFLAEAQRCLAPGGRVLMVDQHPGWISTPILRYLHDEPFRPEAREWTFASTGPLSGANGALAWMVFQRDRSRFEARYPRLRLERYRPHTALRYWLSGGLRPWSLLPGWAFPLATRIDRLLGRISPEFGSFVDVEILKLGPGVSPA